MYQGNFGDISINFLTFTQQNFLIFKPTIKLEISKKLYVIMKHVVGIMKGISMLFPLWKFPEAGLILFWPGITTSMFLM